MKPLQKVALVSIIASIITLALKFTAFYVTDSVSLFSDALESFVNLATGVLAFIVITIVAIPADDKHPYGHDKAEYFASGVEGTLILLAALSILYFGIERLVNPDFIVEVPTGIILSLAAAGVNLVTSKYILKRAKASSSIALEANAKHIMTDVWTTVIIVVGLVIMMYAPEEWQILDPILAIVVSLHIIFTGYQLVRRSIDGLMDAALSDQEISAILGVVENSIPIGCSIKDLRTRRSGARRFADFKLLLPQDMSVVDSHSICDVVEEALDKELSGIIVTIHVEPIIVIL